MPTTNVGYLYMTATDSNNKKDNLTAKQSDYAVFLPAISGFYATFVGKQRNEQYVDPSRFPQGLTDMEQLNWLNSTKALFPYKWSLTPEDTPILILLNKTGRKTWSEIERQALSYSATPVVSRLPRVCGKVIGEPTRAALGPKRNGNWFLIG